MTPQHTPMYRGVWWRVALLASLLGLGGFQVRAQTQEAPLVAQLLAQGAQLEANASLADNAWQAAVQYCRAARYGSTEAQFRLGMLYAFGQGVVPSHPQAAALFSVAAMQGHAQAASMLETMALPGSQLPDCVQSDALPVKAPEATQLAGQQPIDDVLEQLPANKRWVVALTRSVSNWYALDPKLVLAVIAVESNFNHQARSHQNAQGLMQLIPGTAERFNVKNAFDATQNLRGGMRYLRWLLARYQGNLSYTLAAYNAGEGRVDRHRGVPPYAETRDYIRKVLALYGRPSHAFDEALAEVPAWLLAANLR
jgi:soluble lytic murein transglycosylase-like protein